MKKLILGLLAAAFVLSGCNHGPKTASARYSGRDFTGKASVSREGISTTTIVDLSINTSWQLYRGLSDAQIDFTNPVAEGENGGVFRFQSSPLVREYFQLTTPEGKAILAERRLPLEGGHNYRDLGGYRTESGHYVRWGKVYRTDDMHNLTASDLDYLNSLPLTTVVDFRSAQEVETASDMLPESVRNHVELPVTPGSMTGGGSIYDMTAEEAEVLMVAMNVEFATEPDIIAQYREFFALLQDERNLPLSFHCSAGKDRTGMGAALFLSALGVDRETIMTDYLLSNRYLEEKYAGLIAERPNLAPLFTVDAKYINAGLDAMQENYGSVENFLRDQLGVDTAKMRKIYLYK